MRSDALTVRAPAMQAQFIETFILLTMNHQCLIATKSNRICRAEGLLRHAHLLSAAEAVELMGLLRLGAAMGITRGIRVEVLTSLLTEAMPATLTLGVEPPPKNQTEEDALRARVVKERVFGDT